MSHTALAFYRKTQSLQSLDFERPKSLDTVREVVNGRIEHVELGLAQLEKEFYLWKKPEDEIKEILPHVHDVMIRNQVSHINSSVIIVDTMDKSTDKEEMRGGYPNPVVVVSNYNKKINAFCPGRFKGLLDDLDKVMVCLHKYCRSFYQGTVQDSYIETAHHYELKRLDYANAARHQMDDIFVMAKAYNSEEGVSKSMFGLSANELARRCDCGSLPFLLVFPECCQKITSACLVIRRWVQEDSEYVDYIKKDIIDLERKKDIQSRLVRDVQQRQVQTNHKVKSLKREVNDLEDQLEKVKEREASVEQDIKRMEDEIKFTQMDIEAKEGEKGALRKNAGTIFDHTEVNERCERLSSEISKLLLHIPNVHRQIENVVSGKKFIIHKRELLYKRRDDVEHFSRVAQTAQQDCSREEREMLRIEVCLSQLKQIYLYRTTPDMMKKIFYNMPTEARRITLRPIKGALTGAKLDKVTPRKDLIERAVAIVSHEIYHDWQKLYRSLPFHPPRGVATIEDDLDDIIKEQYRAKPEVQARTSLARWRRMHSRANIDELKVALQGIGHRDISTKLNTLVASRDTKQSQPRMLLANTTGDPTLGGSGREDTRPKSRIGYGLKYQQVKDAAQRFMVLQGPYRYNTAADSGATSEMDDWLD